MEKLSFVIPCYNSEKMIKGVLQRIIETVEADQRFDYEIICVNDASKDNTFGVLRGCAEENRKIKAVDLSKNYGQHAALMAGFHQVTGDYVVCLDDDGQNPPEEMFKLIDKLLEGYDLVSAKFVDEKRKLIRRMGTKVSLAMSSYLIGKPKDIDLNSYFVFRRYIVEYITRYNNPYPFVLGQILQVTRSIANVELPRPEREIGESGYSLQKLISLWMNGFTAFSEKPLVVAGYFGFVSAIVGFVMAIVTIIRKFMNPQMPAGYASTIACILFMGGIILFFCGLLGEYIGRIYISINNVPQFAIRDKINIEKIASDHSNTINGTSMGDRECGYEESTNS